MFNSNECPSVELLQKLALDQLPDPPAGDVERHVLDCEPCAQATLNLVTDDTLLGAVRQAGSPAKGLVGNVTKDRADSGHEDDGTRHPERVNQLIAKLRDLPTRELSDVDSATVLSGEAGLEAMHEIDWSTCFAASQSADEIGRLADFRVLKLLGHGGMGGVFLAEDMQLGRRVALKIMRPEFASRPGATERFLREAKAVAAVHDEHIVTIYQVGQATIPGQVQAIPFLAQELLSGETLEQKLKREGRLSADEAVSIGRQIALGLAAAHERGLIHRDIKPANVFLQSSRHVPRDDGRGGTDLISTQGAVAANDSQTAIGFPHAERDGYIVKLLDFGLARAVGDTANLTQSGMILGTPAYMAPEQARGETVDARADLFSLGCVLYRMLTGQSAFGGKDVLAILTSLATVTPPAVKSIRDDVPDELSELIDQLLAKDRNARPVSASDVARRLATLGRPALETRVDRNAGRPRSAILRIALGLAACALFGVIVITLKDKDGKETTIKIDTPEGTKVVGVEQTAGADGGREATRPITEDHVTSLERLDRSKIPEVERFSWQPKELVAVIGTHQSREWSRLRHLIFHPSGDYFLTEPEEGRNGIWSTRGLNRVTESGEPGFPDGTWNGWPQFSADGTCLFTATGRYSGDFTQPDRPTFRLVASRPTHKVTNDAQSSQVVTPDGKWLLIAGGPHGILEAWDVTGDGYRFVSEIPCPENCHPYKLELSNDGKRLAIFVVHPTGRPSHRIQLCEVNWSAADGPALKTIGEPIPAFHGAMSDDGMWLAKREDGQPSGQLLDLSSSPPRVEMDLGSLNQCQFSPDGRWLAVNRGEIVIWAKGDSVWREHAKFAPSHAGNSPFWFSPDGDSLVISEYLGGRLRVLNLTADAPVERVSVAAYLNLAFSPNGRLLATGGRDEGAVWMVDGAEPTKRAGILQGPCSEMPPSFSPDSDLVAFTHYGTDVWSLRERSPLMTYNERVRFERFAPAGKSVWVWGEDSKLIAFPWRINNRGRFERETTPVEVATFAKTANPREIVRRLNGSLQIAVNLRDEGILQVFELTNPTKLRTECQHPSRMVSSFNLSTDGQALAALPNTQTGSGIVWDLTETPPRAYRLASESGGFDCVFSPSGALLFVATRYGIEIHHWASQRILRTIPYPGSVNGLVLHPDGQHLATVNGNGTVYILRIPELAEN